MDENNFIGKRVKVKLVDFSDEVEYEVMAITGRNVIFKTPDFRYSLIPWHEIVYMDMDLQKSEIVTGVEQKLENSIQKLEDEFQISDTDKTVAVEKAKKINELIPEDYTWEWDDEDEKTSVLVSDDEEEESIKIDFGDEEITVFKSKDFELSKKIGKAVEIYSITRDYDDEEEESS